MKKFPKIRYPSDPETDGLHNGEVVVTEKLDGANFRFTRDEDGGLVVGTRKHVYDVPDENLPVAFEHAVEYVQSQLDGANQGWLDTYMDGSWTLYGEAMHLHSLEYPDIDWHQPEKGNPHVALEADQPNVVLFDARQDGEWVDWNDFAEMVHSSPFETAPIIERGSPDGLSFEVPDESMFGGQPEGIVARRVDGAVRAKKVTEDFKETNATTFEDPSKAQSDAAEFVAMYVTEARITNVAQGLVDEGLYDSLQMQMMEDLPREVLKDAMAENGWDLLTNNFECEWDDDFKGEVRSKTSKKCARILKSAVQQF